MFRRALLSSLGTAAAAATTGCLSTGDAAQAPAQSTTTSTVTTESTQTKSIDPSEHTVEVTRRVDFGPTGLTRVLRASDGGKLTVDLTCPDDATESASATVAEDEWRAFECRVLSADVESFADRYDCEGDCPSDSPPARVTFDVDGCVTEVLVESNADVPETLAAILDSLDALAVSVDYPSCG